MYLIVGLGNPGQQYELTRHNVGFLLLDIIAQTHGADFLPKSKFNAEIATFNTGNEKIILAKPCSYMNLSGEPVQAICHFYKIPVSHLLTIHDDIDLRFGQNKFKIGGSHAGHNGLRSIDKSLGNKDYARLRVGVGRPEHKDYSVANYVLSNFSKEELNYIEKLGEKISADPVDLLAGRLNL